MIAVSAVMVLVLMSLMFPVEAFKMFVVRVVVVIAAGLNVVVIRFVMVAVSLTERLSNDALSLDTLVVENIKSLLGTHPKTWLLKLIIYSVKIL